MLIFFDRVDLQLWLLHIEYITRIFGINLNFIPLHAPKQKDYNRENQTKKENVLTKL